VGSTRHRRSREVTCECGLRPSRPQKCALRKRQTITAIRPISALQVWPLPRVEYAIAVSIYLNSEKAASGGCVEASRARSNAGRRSGLGTALTVPIYSPNDRASEPHPLPTVSRQSICMRHGPSPFEEAEGGKRGNRDGIQLKL
jgi:hypothetical protein